MDVDDSLLTAMDGDLRLEVETAQLVSDFDRVAAKYPLAVQDRAGVRFLCRVRLAQSREKKHGRPAKTVNGKTGPLPESSGPKIDGTELPAFTGEPWNDPSRTVEDRVYQLLKAHPRMRSAEMAVIIYGKSEDRERFKKDVANIYSQLHRLKAKGKADNATGRWEVTPS